MKRAFILMILEKIFKSLWIRLTHLKYKCYIENSLRNNWLCERNQTRGSTGVNYRLSIHTPDNNSF